MNRYNFLIVIFTIACVNALALFQPSESTILAAIATDTSALTGVFALERSGKGDKAEGVQQTLEKIE